MAAIEKVRQAISQIAQHPKNTTASDIDWVVKQLKENGFNVREPRKTRHGVLYKIGSFRFHVCTHNPGSKQVKPVYVNEFLKVMIELGLYEE